MRSVVLCRVPSFPVRVRALLVVLVLAVVVALFVAVLVVVRRAAFGVPALFGVVVAVVLVAVLVLFAVYDFVVRRVVVVMTVPTVFVFMHNDHNPASFFSLINLPSRLLDNSEIACRVAHRLTS